MVHTVFLKDECSFVSLRDVERTLCVMAWFYEHREPLFDYMRERAERDAQEDGIDPDDPVTVSIV